MGMSTYAVGIREADDSHRKMVAAARACYEAGLEPPKKLADYFGGHGLKEVMGDPTIGLEMDVPAHKGGDESRAWIEVDLREVPAGVRKIRLINSW